MAILKGMDAKNAHWSLIKDGFRQVGSQMNSSVIYNVYWKPSVEVVLLLDKETLIVKEVV